MINKNEYIERPCQTLGCKEYSFCASKFCETCQYKKRVATRRAYSLKHWQMNHPKVALKTNSN